MITQKSEYFPAAPNLKDCCLVEPANILFKIHIGIQNHLTAPVHILLS